MTMPKKTDPLTKQEMQTAAKEFYELFSVVRAVMPDDTTVEDTLKIMENVAKLAQKKRAEDREKEVTEKFGFNKEKPANA